MTNPYKSLEKEAFWRPFVAERSMFDITDLWRPKHKIDNKTQIATYGSCFAQHIGRALDGRGFKWLRTEKPPQRLSEDNKKRFNFDIFSSRTGNIYTTSLLKQWCSWAAGKETAPEEVWEQGGRYYDPFRPIVEPNGFASADEVHKTRRVTIQSFKKSITDCDIFVFTLGLTESWFNKEYGYEYPMCPGTAAGQFDERKHGFINQQYEGIKKSLYDAMGIMRELNPQIKFILTVSPVPLTATYSGNNVLVATMESKSILRAVAGSLSCENDEIDYFPSYEIINSPVFRGAFFEPNMRSVNPHGVGFVMDTFFKCQKLKVTGALGASKEDAKCEEEILGSFGGTK
ncbi:GSCFA family protein [Idiomarina fontislapidosi]|uniref:GSCFA family protein n=1 Tax=Idiomarina fontislapidosi TaxID=263723 RepID=A0A432XQY1_9GAMM|nr:GSCFA domain-containing protein [Idiomarina fontislapidosi]PYE30739.1 GSCFA family protein [Idiomarina fontislapidosi]RUO51094.1 GSCFA family protein [Idiomarina fontislapidosi]